MGSTAFPAHDPAGRGKGVTGTSLQPSGDCHPSASMRSRGMNRPLALTQRQIRAICEGASKAGYAPILQIGNILVRLVPKEIAEQLPTGEEPKEAPKKYEFKL